MQDVEFAVVALAGDPAEPLELVPAQRVKPLVTCSVLQQTHYCSVLESVAKIQCRPQTGGKEAHICIYLAEFVTFTSIPLGSTVMD